MNKTAIKNFAIWARRKLIADITYKAGMLGISENGIAQPLPQSTRDLQFFDIGTKDYAEVSGTAIDQREALIKAIQHKEQTTDYKTAFRNVVEEVAYTWFNRLIAVRFMEVNDYLPSHIRVLSSENEGKLEPDFVTTPFDTDLEFTPYEKDLVYQLKDENKLDELFRMLFIKQCNKLSEILPGLFETISDYTELLLNISFTDKDGIVYHLTHDIAEDEFNVEKEGQVEIIGWMYQYYNTEPKDEVFALLKKNVKITKERIPAATQLFTPDWIVRYMVENSLGRLWVEGHPNESLKANWKYYLEEAEQEPDVQEQLKKIREEYAKLNPTDIKVIDPCMGSGHILVYAFEVLMQIYTTQGYIEREAAKLILQNNLYGIDIDTRAYQLAYFAVMMKARQYNRRIFNEHITPNLIAIKNPEDISKSILKRLGGLEPLGLRLIEDFEDAEEYGSILQVDYTEHDLSLLEMKLEEIEKEAEYGNWLDQTEAEDCEKLMRPLIKQARLLAQKYDVVVTNPPYMGNGNMGNKLLSFVKKHFPKHRTDLYAVFIDRCNKMLHEYGMQAMITQQSWMFVTSFADLRKDLLNNSVISMAHLGARAFDEINGEVVQTTTFIVRNNKSPNYIGHYCRLVDGSSEIGKEKLFFDISLHYYTSQKTFEKIPGMPYAYWCSPNMFKIFDKAIQYKEIATARRGTITGNDDRFLRLWHEIDKNRFSIFDSKANKWIPINKGGDYRKWYGNNWFVIDWADDGYEIKNYKDENGKLRSRPQNIDFFFRPGITWTYITSQQKCFRYYPSGFAFAGVGPGLFPKNEDDLNFMLAYNNSIVFRTIMIMMGATTISLESGEIERAPILISERYNKKMIDTCVDECIDCTRQDWDSFEISWDFKHHPLLPEKTNSTPAAFHTPESQSEWNADAQQMEFAVFCVENLATDLNIDPTDAYDLLSVKSDILSTYIIPCYDALHSQDKQYIIDDIKQVMRSKGVLA